MNDFVDFQKATVQCLNNDILLTTYKKAALLDLNDARELDDVYVSMAKGNEVFCLADFTAADTDLSNEAQAYFSHKARILPSIKAAAIIINTVPARIVARFYVQYFKPLYPVKVFGNLKEAQVWFESLRQQEFAS